MYNLLEKLRSGGEIGLNGVRFSRALVAQQFVQAEAAPRLGLTQGVRPRSWIPRMDKSQAEEIAEAVLEPELRVQEEQRQKREAKAAYLSRKRRTAWFALAGAAIGVAAAYISGAHFSLGVVLGVLVGVGAGSLVTHRRSNTQ